MSEPSRDEEIALARERAKASLPLVAFVLLGLLAITMPLPRRFVAALPLAVAAYLSVRLLRSMQDRPMREKVWTALSLGIIASMLVSLGVQAAFYGPLSAYETCMGEALTSAARASCDQLHLSRVLGGMVR
ncbi:MAG: hypothetical protein JWP82_2049 [Humibacillus sp.]|nr:hypothetical protein [Humibacillus sp.]